MSPLTAPRPPSLALTGLERVDKIVRINDRGLDLRAEGTNLFLVYADQTGALGRIGTLLGQQGVNIAAAALSPNTEDGTATLVLRIDRVLTEDEMEAVNAELSAENAFQVAF